MLHHECLRSDSIKILDFLVSLRRSCDSVSIQVRAANWLFLHFMTDNMKQDLLRKIEWKHPNNVNQGYVPMKTYDETVNYLFETFETDDNNPPAHVKITHLK